MCLESGDGSRTFGIGTPKDNRGKVILFVCVVILVWRPVLSLTVRLYLVTRTQHTPDSDCQCDRELTMQKFRLVSIDLISRDPIVNYTSKKSLKNSTQVSWCSINQSIMQLWPALSQFKETNRDCRNCDLLFHILWSSLGDFDRQLVAWAVRSRSLKARCCERSSDQIRLWADNAAAAHWIKFLPC